METIQMLGSLGEFVGAIAVVATLVYLAIQVRHSKEAMEANTRSVDESRNLALAQTYQARAALAEQSIQLLADSTFDSTQSRKSFSYVALECAQTVRTGSPKVPSAPRKPAN